MKQYSAFTLKSGNLLNMLSSQVSISSNVTIDRTDITINNRNGLWDTGASKTSIDKRIVTLMNLAPIGKISISTANGVVAVDTYLIDVTLPNNVTIKNVIASGTDLGNVDLLIGMDIICLGDFSITNTDNSTTFSFRIPSIQEIDYVKDANELK